MIEFEKWFWNDYDPHDDSYGESSQIKTKTGYIAGMECALRLYCADVTNFHKNILQELKELDN